MGSSAQPLGAIPDKVDVKPTPSPSKEAERDQTVTEASSNKTGDSTASLDPEIEEADLNLIEEQKKVPYMRFKEKNDEAKRLKAELQDKDRRYQEDLRRAIEDAELRAASRLSKKDESEDLDPYESKIRATRSEVDSLKADLKSLQAKSENQRLEALIERLEKKYPEADSLAVMGWAKVRPDVDLEEFMEKSHNQNLERVSRKVKEIIDHKKAKIKTAVPTRETGFRIKESERPKTLKEAHALLSKLLG